MAFWVSATTSSVDAATKANALVIAVIHQYEVRGEPRICIATSVCTFMPDLSACVTLTGFDDKKIWETLARIREECAKAAGGRAKAAGQSK